MVGTTPGSTASPAHLPAAPGACWVQGSTYTHRCHWLDLKKTSSTPAWLGAGRGRDSCGQEANTALPQGWLAA